MSDSTTLSRYEKVSTVSTASPTSSSVRSQVYIPILSKTVNSRPAEAVKSDSNSRNEVSSGLVYSIKSFRRKKHVQNRLHPLESDSPRYSHQHRHLSVALSSSRYGTSPYSPRVEQGATNPEDSQDEMMQLQRLNAHLSANEMVDKWIRSYEFERGTFASFAVFTELKLDEVQETYAGRPNAVETAACCATLLKMPGIVGCYKTLLEKMSAGIQSAIYLPETTSVPDSTTPEAMATLVQSFYARIPYFERVRELENSLLTSRSISDLNVLKALTIDDVARIFQYVPLPHLQAGIAQVYATNPGMLDQLVTFLQREQGLLLFSRNGTDVDDPEYPVHVPLATSAQICRAIANNAASFSTSGREMILCAIVNLVDVSSFFDVYQHFDRHGKMCFLHHLSLIDDLNQLKLVVNSLPDAGESLFRLYVATCSIGVGDVSQDQGVKAHPKEIFFRKLLCPDMEFLFLNDLATYLTKTQWQLLTREFEKNENERKARKQRRESVKAAEYENEEDANEGVFQSQSVVETSIDRFQMLILNYLRHHHLSSAELLQIMVSTLLSTLEEKEFSQLFDSCWTRFPLDSQWAKALKVIQELGSGGSSFYLPSVTVNEANQETIAVIRLKMLKKVFKMLTGDEKAMWMDRINAKHPTENYLKTIQDLKDTVTAVLNKLPDLSDPLVYISRMDTDLKMFWLEVLIDSIVKEPGNSVRITALKQVLQPFANGKMPLPELPLEPIKTAFTSPDKTLEQLNAEKAALVFKFAVADEETCEKVVENRGTSPIQELQEAEEGSEIQKVLTTLIAQRSEAQVLELLQKALEKENNDAVDKEEEAVNLSRRLKRKLTAVKAVSEPMEWQEFVKIGSLDVGCQTNFENDQEGTDRDTVSPLEAPLNTVSDRRVSTVLMKRTPLTLSVLLGKTGTAGGKNSKKDRYQKINSVAVPRAISGLITSWRMNTDQLNQFAKKSLANVLKIIADAYGEMLTATRKRQQQRLSYATPRGSGRMLTLSQIVYQSFLHSYGLPTIADMHLLAFSCALENYRAQHLRVEFFARFCFQEVSKAQLTNYLEFLECIVCEDLTSTMMGNSPLTTPSSTSRNVSLSTPPASKRSRFALRISVPEKENWFISVDRAQEIALLCFREMRKTTVATFCENLVTIAASTPESISGELVINVDQLLPLVVAEWQLEQVRRERHLLDSFRAGDVNGDGQLTSAEFKQIVLGIDASRDLGDILLMYSDTLRRTECDQLTADVFLQVAREHELDRVVWQGDGDLFSVVNEATDMEATWKQVRGFFVGTLEALARDLPSKHFLRICEGAGCGCLKCLLDGYIGFQKMRREFALTQKHQQAGHLGRRNSYVGVSSQLVWARFWHLMRQLHDAAAESDGIVTPWEGIEYKREQPALALAPRSNCCRRDSLPNFLFPDTKRITAKMSKGHHPEAFDAPTIQLQFSYLLSHVSVKDEDASPLSE